MKILFDINIILDLLLPRKPYLYNAVKLVSAVENSVIDGYLCATSVTTIQYLVQKTLGRSESRRMDKKLLSIFTISQVNKITLERALDSNLGDFEDAVMNESAISSGLDGIVTRNLKDFKKSKLSIYGPDELTAILNL